MTVAQARASSGPLKAKLLRGLADTSRLAVLESLVDGPKCVTEIVTATTLSQSNVSNHLACLRDCGLVSSERRGRYIHYRVSRPEILELLESAERAVAVIGRFVAECQAYQDDGEFDGIR